MNEKEIIKHRLESCFIQNEKVADLIPVLLDNRESWKDRNNARGAYYGSFLLSQGTAVVVKYKGQSYVIDNNDTVLFEELVGLTGLTHDTLDWLTINETNVFDDNSHVNVSFDGTNLVVSSMDDTVLISQAVSATGDVNIIQGDYTFNVTVNYLPGGAVSHVINYESKKFIYQPAIPGNEVTEDLNKVLSGVTLQTNSTEIFKLVSDATHYLLSSQAGNELVVVEKANGTFNFSLGKLIITEAIAEGTYYLNAESELYDFTPGTDPVTDNQNVKQQLPGISFATTDSTIYKMVQADDIISIFKYSAGDWFLVHQVINKTGVQYGVTITDPFEEGVYYFNQDFEKLLVVSTTNGEFEKLPFLSIDYQGEQKFITLKAEYSEYTFNQLKIQIGETWYNLIKLDNTTDLQTVSLGGEDVNIQISEALPFGKPAIDNYLSDLFDYDRSNGETVFQFDILPDGTLINVISKEQFEERVKTVPAVNENFELDFGGHHDNYNSGFAKVVVSELDADKYRIALSDAISGENRVAYTMDKTFVGVTALASAQVTLIAKQAFDFSQETDFTFYFDMDGIMQTYVSAGTPVLIDKLFPYGDISIDAAVWDKLNYAKARLVVGYKNGFYIELRDVNGRFYDKLKINKQGINNSVAGLFSIDWTYQGEAFQEQNWYVDQQDKCYLLIDNGSEIIEVNKTFPWIVFVWGTYAGDKIVTLVDNGGSCSVDIDGVETLVFDEEGQSKTWNDVSVTLEKFGPIQAEGEIIIDGNRNIVIEQGGETIPEHSKQIWEDQNFDSVILNDWTPITGNVALLQINRYPDGYVARVYDVTQSYVPVVSEVFQVEQIVNDRLELSIATINFKLQFDQYFNGVALHFDEAGNIHDVTDPVVVSLFEKTNEGITETASPDEIYFFRDNAPSTQGNFKGMISNLDGTFFYSHYADATPAELSAALSGSGYEFDLTQYTTALGGLEGYGSFYYKGQKVAIKKKGQGKTDAEAGITWQGVDRPTENCILSIFGFDNYAGYGAVWNMPNGSSRYYTGGVGRNPSTANIYGFLGSSPIRTNSWTQNTLYCHLFYNVEDGLWYDLDIDYPIYQDIENQVNNGIETIAESTPALSYEIQTEQIINYTSDPTFELLKEESGVNTTFTFKPITQADGTEMVKISEFQYAIEPIILDTYEFDFDYLVNPVTTPGTADVYVNQTQSITHIVGAVPERFIPITISGTVNLVVSGNDGELITPGDGEQVEYNIAPNFQFNGWFARFR
nr:hypothetical protein [uncultured Draconibacterium sp.]